MKAFSFVTIESVLIIAFRSDTLVKLQLQQVRIYLINIHQSFDKKTSNYLDRELHTRRVVITAMTLIHTCASGVQGNAPPIFILQKWRDLVHSERSKLFYY